MLTEELHASGVADKVASHEEAAHEKRNWVRLTFDCNNRCVFCLDSDTHDGRMRDRAAAPLRRALADAARGRRFFDTLYRPADVFRIPAGDTIACRCEEVTAAAIAAAAVAGCTGPNQAKAFLRCGMGPCQGRLCALTVTEVIAQSRGVAPADVGTFRPRPPVKPLTLGELATLPVTPAAEAAVVRAPH